MKIRYQELYDSHNCETCGYSDATGAKIWFDDKLVYELKPVAHCYDSVTIRNAEGQQC